jgi:phosphohistidine phosphatase SixA
MLALYRISILTLLTLILIINLSSANRINVFFKENILSKIFAQQNSSLKDIKIDTIQNEVDEKLINLLKVGNNTIFIRHSHKISEDFQQGFDILQLNGFKSAYINKNNCLTARGREEAKFIGIFFKKFNIPVSKVHSSPICRCAETANIAFQDYEVHEYLSYHSISNNIKSETFYNNKKSLFFLSPKDNYNKIIIAHGSTPKEVGIDMPSVGQSGILVFNHDTNKVEATLEFNKLAHAFYLID